MEQSQPKDYEKTFIDIIIERAIFQLFKYGPFMKAPTRPTIKKLDEQRIIKSYEEDGKQIEVVAVADIVIPKALVIVASEGMGSTQGEVNQIHTRIVPIDLLIGWWLMSSKFSARMFHYQKEYDDEGKRGVKAVGEEHYLAAAEGKYAHVHMMNPENAELPPEGACVKIKGHLVDIYIDGVRTWKSDLKIGDAKCETIYPRTMEIVK